METRDELRKKLRDKIRGKRTDTSSTNVAAQMKTDPQTALLQMGIDDPAMLSMASSAVKRPEAFLEQLKKRMSITEEEEDDEEAPPPLTVAKTDEDEEEAPPPLP